MKWNIRKMVEAVGLTIATSIERGNSNSEREAREKVEDRYNYFKE